MTASKSNSSLKGVMAIEFAGLAPGPFAGLVLADWGADVIRIDKVDQSSSMDLLCRGKRSLAINPKVPSGLAALRSLIGRADVLIDPFRPDVMEKLGLGPEVFLGKDGINTRLIYARLAGFPRKGAAYTTVNDINRPYSNMAGHDINYIALSGVLSILPGTADRPTFPLNLLADFAGGGLICALGILLALIERATSGCGQVVDVDMVSGTRYISYFPLLHTLHPSSSYFLGPRMTNVIDGGAPFYDVYTCSDGCWISVGCLEPQFFALFLDKFRQGLQDTNSAEPSGAAWQPTPETQMNREEWPKLREYLTKGFSRYPRDYWAGLFHSTDACVVPVLSPEEAATLSYHSFTASDASAPTELQPQPHPRLSRSPFLDNSASSDVPLRAGQHTKEILRSAGFSEEDYTELAQSGALGIEVQVAVAGRERSKGAKL